jgi:hypothetical protein
MIKNIFAAAAISAAAFGAQASSNLLVNGELNGTTGSYVYNGSPDSVTANYGGTLPLQSDTVDGWSGSFVSIASGNGSWGVPSGLANFDAATQGDYVAGVQADGVLSQELSLAAGTYSLTWLDANRGDNQSYVVSFVGDGTTSYLGTNQFSTVGGAGWKLEHLVFTTSGGGELVFKGSTIWGQSDSTSFIDNVQLTAVPEPTSLALMVIGALGLVAWRRRAQV